MKKQLLLKRISLVIASLMVLTAHSQIFNNGSFVNSPGTGAGGADESWLQNVSLNMDLFGFNANSTVFYRVADDFTVPAGQQWHLDSVYLYCYQTGAPTSPSPISMINMQVLNDNSGMPGTTVVWGDTVTDILVRSAWSHCYRVSDATTGTATNRPVFLNVCGTPGLTLSAGTYWLDYSISGNATYTGPWANPLVVMGNTTTGNGMHVKGAMNPWASAVDDSTLTPQGFPFSLFGTNLLGINEWNNAINISIYPNPFSLQTTVTFTEEQKQTKIKITDILGKEIKTINFKGKQLTIEKGEMTNGIYFLQITDEKKNVANKKIVIQ